MKLKVLKTYVQTVKPLMQLILILIIENGKGCVNYYNIIYIYQTRILPAKGYSNSKEGKNWFQEHICFCVQLFWVK